MCSTFKVIDLKSVVFSVALLLAAQASAAQSIDKDFPGSFQITVSNPLPVAREQVLVVVLPSQVKAGPGAQTATRVPWSHQLNSQEATQYTLSAILGDWKIAP